MGVTMYQALYRTYRPETFEGLMGQEHIIRILKNQLETGTTSHAYLFSGTRGTGKTTVARILAKGLNCMGEGNRPCGTCSSCREIRDGLFLDVIEIDAASNNGVDNIRELRESVKYPPSVGRKKVYIIDEVHMLSPGAFNALLKTLEEPPEYVTFILATTELQKLPATILSRCLRLDFRRVSEKSLKEGIQRICGELGVVMEEDATGVIAAAADGSVRDCLSILDQCTAAGSGRVTRQDVLEVLGTPGEEIFIEWTDRILRHQIPEALQMLDTLLGEGKEVRQLMKDWISHYRNLMLTKFMKNPEDLINLSKENVERIREQSQRTDMAEISDAILQLSRTLQDARWSTQPRILLEVAIVTLASGMADQPPLIRPAAPPAPKASPVPKASPAPTVPKATETSSVPDTDGLWHRIFEDGEAMKSSYNLIRTCTSLQSVGETEFTVAATSEIKKQYVLDNKDGLEKLMEKHTGRFRSLRCIVGGEGEGQAGGRDTLEERKARIENAFNIHVEIE
jgi:DNA polymerase-3 subunit gamma/tau